MTLAGFFQGCCKEVAGVCVLRTRQPVAVAGAQSRSARRAQREVPVAGALGQVRLPAFLCAVLGDGAAARKETQVKVRVGKMPSQLGIPRWMVQSELQFK